MIPAAATVKYRSFVQFLAAAPTLIESCSTVQKDSSQALRRTATRIYMQRSLLQADLRIIHGLNFLVVQT